MGATCPCYEAKNKRKDIPKIVKEEKIREKTGPKNENEEKIDEKINEPIERKSNQGEIQSKIKHPKVDESRKNEKKESEEKLIENKTNKEKIESNINEIDSKQDEIIAKKFEFENNEYKILSMQNEIESQNLDIESKQNDIKSHHFEFDLKKIEEIEKKENKYQIQDFGQVKNDIIFEPEKNEISKFHKPIPFRIVNRVMKSLCKILSNMYYEVGFFLDFSASLKFLVTNYQIINSYNNIEIEIWNQKKMNLSKKDRFFKYIEKPKDISIIEIKQSDEIYNDIQFLNL